VIARAQKDRPTNVTDCSYARLAGGRSSPLCAGTRAAATAFGGRCSHQGRASARSNHPWLPANACQLWMPRIPPAGEVGVQDGLVLRSPEWHVHTRFDPHGDSRCLRVGFNT
jgi:hypothetical protein